MKTEKEKTLERVTKQNDAYQNYLWVIEKEWQNEATELANMIFNMIYWEGILNNTWTETERKINNIPSFGSDSPLGANMVELRMKTEKLEQDINEKIMNASPEGLQIIISYSQLVVKENTDMYKEYSRLLSMISSIRRNQKLMELGV